MRPIVYFLGFAGYYRFFIQGFAYIAAPLHEGRSASSRLNWTSDMAVAFQNLRKALTRSTVLDVSEFSLHFIVEIDAFSKAVGEILSQKGDYGMVHPIQLAIHTMNDTERNYSTCER